MKSIFISIFTFIIFLSSCGKKDNNVNPAPNTFQATVDGEAITFKVISATLLRSTQTDEKRLDIQGLSEDEKKRLIITIGDNTSEGNGMRTKTYVLNPFPEDNPDTEDIDESFLTEGYTTYSTSLGNNNWLTGIYEEAGAFTVTASDAANTTISGNFETRMVNMNDETKVVTITNGKINNIKYTVLN